MKLNTLLILLIFTFNAYAENPFEKINTDKEFEKLNKLESIVNHNPNFTVDSVIKEQPQLLKELGIEKDTKSSVSNTEDPMNPAGFPAFWWGFCLGVWGIIIVYLITDNDKSAINKTVKGCITASAIYLGVYAIVVIIGLSAAAATSY